MNQYQKHGPWQLIANLISKKNKENRGILQKIPSKVSGVQTPLLIGSKQDWKHRALTTIDAKAKAPHILQHGTNQHLRMAERALRKANRKLVYPMKAVYGCEYSGVKVDDIASSFDQGHGHNSLL